MTTWDDSMDGTRQAAVDAARAAGAIRDTAVSVATAAAVAAVEEGIGDAVSTQLTDTGSAAYAALVSAAGTVTDPQVAAAVGGAGPTHTALASAIAADPTVTGKVAKGELVYSLADYGGALATAIGAIPSGATLYLPPGIYTANQIGAHASKHLTFVGSDPRTTIITAGSNPYAFSYPGGTAGSLTFRNIGFQGSTSAIFALYRESTARATFTNCRFSAFPWVAIQTYGTDLTLIDCEFTSDGTAGDTMAVQHLWGAASISIHRCRTRFLHRGYYLTDSGGAPGDVTITDCHMDGGWQYLKATASGSGGAVTYTATTVTDTGASFSFATPAVVRALKTLRAGNVTARTGNQFTDSGASFITAGVRRGDIVRTATAWAVVYSVPSATTVQVEGWMSLADYSDVVTPAVGDAYTVYGVTTADVDSATATTITISRWTASDGTLTTPAAGTRYEVVPASEYQCYVYGAGRVKIANNTIRRAWADCISAQEVNEAIITGNTIYGGRDVGITVGQPSGATRQAIISDNQITHVGTAGIWLGYAPDAVVNGNSINDANWSGTGTTSDTYCGITVDLGCDRANVVNNTITRTLSPHPTAAMTVYGATDGVTFASNRTRGFTTHLALRSGATNISGSFEPDTTVLLLTGAAPPRGDFSGTGAPAVVAAVGSTYRRKDGGAATSLYVKESGTGSAGWVGK